MAKRAPKKFLVTYHQPAAAVKRMQKDPAAAAESMQAWMKWAEKCGSQLVEMGAPLAGGLKLTAEGEVLPSKRRVGGYSILQAASMAGAKRLLKGHPHLSWVKGCEIEIHEFVKMG